MAIVVTGRVEAEFAGVDAGWTDIREDLIGGVNIRRGLRGDSPDTRVAAAGACTFTLNNSAANSLGLMGAYSWDNVNRRAGFKAGIRVRMTLTRSGIVIASSSVANPSVITTASAHYLVTGETVTIAGHAGSTPDINGSHEVTVLSATTFSIPVNVTGAGTGGECSIDYPQFIGKITGIRTAPGSAGVRGTYVTVSDWLNEAAKEILTGLELMDNARGHELVEAVLDVMSHQPADTDLDEGLDVYAFAFDSIGKTAHAEFARIARSGYDLLFLKADGTLRYENRDYRFAHNLTADVVVDGAMMEMSPDVDVERIVNRVVGTAHPRAVDQAFSVLYSLQDKPLFSPGQTRTFRGKYTDAANAGEKVGAIDVQTPVSGVDFTADTVQTTAVGTADTPFTLRPTAAGFYTGFSGSVSSVADGNEATSMSPTGGFLYQTYEFQDIAAPDNATVEGLALVVVIRNNAAAGHFANWYHRLRVNSIDLDGGVETTGGQPAGLFGYTKAFPTGPGGVAWNVGLVNALQAGGAFNWDNATPELVDISITGRYASAVAATDRTSSFSIVFRPGGSEFEVDVTNNGTDGSYLTKFEVRGRRITTYDPVELVSQDAASIEDFGPSDIAYDMPYQGDSTLVQGVIDYIRDFYKEPRSFLPSITVRDPGDDDALAVALLRCDISSLVSVREDVTGIDQEYFINGVEKEIRDNVVVVARWLVTPADPTAWWLFGVSGRSEFDTTTIFGPI